MPKTIIKDITKELEGRRYIIVGDVHGCYDELQDLLTKLEFNFQEDALISTGDLVDRGPGIDKVLIYVLSIPHFYCVQGNHENKLERALRGNPVNVSDGLGKTLDALQARPQQLRDDVQQFLKGLPHILKVPAGYVVHAGFDPSRSVEEQRAEDCLYARYVGGVDKRDAAGEYWFKKWSGPPVFFGHIVLGEHEAPAGHQFGHPVTLSEVYGLDGGCVFGGELRAYDSRDGEVHSVKARKAYYTRTVAQSSEALPVQIREDYVKRGLLRSDRSDDGELVVYTYTDKCTFEGAWDDITTHSRGHVFNVKTGECVARPFSKFHNLGDRNAPMDSFDWTQLFEVYEKLDGWLAVLYRQHGQFAISTRGSFHSTGAVAATKWIQRRDLHFLPDEVTLCFELLSPEQRILLDYGDEFRLTLLAAFNRYTGEEYSRTQVQDWAAEAGFDVARRYSYLLPDLLDIQSRAEQIEGFVLRFADGRRVKVKTDWYQRISKILATVSPISVWEVMVDGKVPDGFLAPLPPEAKGIAEEIKNKLEAQYNRVFQKTMWQCNHLIAVNGSDPKNIALHREDFLGEAAYSAVFAVLRGQMSKVHQIVKDYIFPRANEYAAPDYGPSPLLPTLKDLTEQDRHGSSPTSV